MNILCLINYKNHLKFVLLLSLFCFISSLTIQLVMKENPCLLCLFTRYGFLTVSIICLFALKYINKKSVVFLPLTSLLSLLCLSFYHLGVENHWWLAPSSCKTILPTLNDLYNSKLLITNNRPPCDTVNFKVFGFSMTLISFIISAFLFWVSSISTVLYLSNNRIVK